MGRGANACRRANDSNCPVSAASRSAPCPARPSSRPISSVRPCSNRRRARSRLPITPCSMLLKSCAMPPVSCPIASIFCACRSASSTASRSATAACTRASRVRFSSSSSACACFSSWISTFIPAQRVTAPASSRIGVARTRNQRYTPSCRRQRNSMSYTVPVAIECIHAADTLARSSGCTNRAHPVPNVSSARDPAYASQDCVV